MYWFFFSLMCKYMMISIIHVACERLVIIGNIYKTEIVVVIKHTKRNSTNKAEFNKLMQVYTSNIYSFSSAVLRSPNMCPKFFAGRICMHVGFYLNTRNNNSAFGEVFGKNIWGT